MADSPDDSTETRRLLEQIRARNRRAFDELFRQHQRAMLSFVQRRFDPALRARFDPPDIVQDRDVNGSVFVLVPLWDEDNDPRNTLGKNLPSASVNRTCSGADSAVPLAAATVVRRVPRKPPTSEPETAPGCGLS